MKKSHLSYLVVLGIVALGLFFYITTTGDARYLEAATAGGDYLITHMHEDGSFVYEYDPVTDKETSSYNILRHAGTTYSLLELYEATRDQKYFNAAQRALGYLTEQIGPCPGVTDAECVIENDEIKLGGNGLAILAFAKYVEVSGKYPPKGSQMLARFDVIYRDHAERLAQWIVHVQSPSGEFAVHKMTNGMVDAFKSEYYPGEAMFGLALLSEVSGDRKWLDASHKGAEWVITVRDAGTPTESLPHDHWFLYALNELTKDKQEAIYIDHAKKLTEAIAATQHQGKTGEQKDWNGGYYNPPRSTPTATRNEGLGAAYELFTRAGETAYATVAKDTMARGIAFTLRTQDSNGGFHESLDEHTIRIDYVQHNISALLAFDRIVQSAH
jgi:hypothetical protein